MVIKRKFLGELLLIAGVIDERQLKEAEEERQRTGRKLGDILKEKKYVTDKQLMEVMQLQRGIPYVDLDKTVISRELTEIIPMALARRYAMVPVHTEHGRLFMAMADPLNLVAIEDARTVSNMQVLPMISSRASIEGKINMLYGNENAEQAILELAKDTREDAITNITQSEDAGDDISNAPIVKLINSILEQAIKLNASDIHIEPQEKDVRVRLRVDGQLFGAFIVPKNAQAGVITRIKIMGNMDIAEKTRAAGRTLQDPASGQRDRYPHLGAAHRVRRKGCAAYSGQAELPHSQSKARLYAPEFRKIRSAAENPHGIILLTGPTGSGKSTTLYTMLSELNHITDNIITVEDPVEYILKGLNQVQVNPKAGLTFASGLRSILRQDPDIIMIGEIRDQETVDIAIRAAITGHLVLSTIHTNDAPSTISRLVDMDIPPYMLSAALVGIISQRLVKLICPYCKVPYTPTAAEVKACGLPESFNGTIYKGAGCNFCNNTGYKGRVAVFEIMNISQHVRGMITARESVDAIREYMVKHEAMQTIRMECMRLLINGETSVDEVIRTAYAQD